MAAADKSEQRLRYLAFGTPTAVVRTRIYACRKASYACAPSGLSAIF